MKAQTLVIGAGLIGSSLAMHLGRLGVPGVRVVDFDLEGSLSSSELNAGGVRATMVQPVNIQASKLSIEYFANVAQEVGYRDCGYLWLHSSKKASLARQARKTQEGLGWRVEEWDVPTLTQKTPLIDKTDGIDAAFFAPRDGLVNPNLLKMHYRAQAKTSGVEFEDRVLVREVEETPNSSAKYRVVAEKFGSVLSEESKNYVLTGKSHSQTPERVVYEVDRIVNCAGPWAPDLAKILGYASPSYPVRRQVCIFDGREMDLTPYGMIVDTSGVYFHPEATNGLAGFANADEPVGKNYRYDGEEFFMERIWPALYERSSQFEQLKHLTGWAGLYEVSPDKTGIVGKVKERLFEAHSFSGHGAMHSYAAGLGLAELMEKGRYETIDLSEMDGGRFEREQQVREELVI